MDLDKNTAVSISVGTAIAVVCAIVAAVFTVTSTVNSIESSIDSLDSQLSINKEELSRVSKRVLYLDCRERELSAVALGILADISQLVAVIEHERESLEQKMASQLQNKRDQLQNSSC